MTQKNHTPLDQKNLISTPKEGEPVPKPAENLVIKESVEKEVHPEITPHVEVRAESIKLPPDLKKVGLETNKTSAFNDFKNISIPLADDKVLTGLHQPLNTGWRWLAEFSKWLLARAHITLKVVHGKVVRVIQK